MSLSLFIATWFVCDKEPPPPVTRAKGFGEPVPVVVIELHQSHSDRLIQTVSTQSRVCTVSVHLRILEDMLYSCIHSYMYNGSL